MRFQRLHLTMRLLWLLSIYLVTAACTAEGALVGGVIGTTIVGAQAPTHDLEQVYYFGVFDPLEQVPPSIYRVTVRGQSSFLNNTNFASGWLPAPFVDSLNTTIKWDQSVGGPVVTPSDASPPKEGPKTVQTVTASDPAHSASGGDPGPATKTSTTTTTPAKEEESGTFSIGRRLILFGPEGFRESPPNHRLVIVMAADPSAYFDNVAKAMGDRAIMARAEGTLNHRAEIAEFLLKMAKDRESMTRLDSTVEDVFGKDGT